MMLLSYCLHFFILTTQFKKPDVEQIKPPSSISEKLLDDKDLMTINITSQGKFYFNLLIISMKDPDY